MFLFCSASQMLIGMVESRRPHAAHGANLVHQQKPFCPVCKRRQRGGVRPRKRKIAIEQAIANEEPRLCRPAFDAGGIELGSLGGGPRQAKVALQHAASTVAGLHSIAASLSSGSSFDVSAPRSLGGKCLAPWASAALQCNLRVERAGETPTHYLLFYPELPGTAMRNGIPSTLDETSEGRRAAQAVVGMKARG